MRSVYELTFIGARRAQGHDLRRGARPGVETPAVDKISSDGASVRRLISRFADRSRLRVCYEAGPTGFELQRLLSSMGVAARSSLRR
jgi:hypothetical protein